MTWLKQQSNTSLLINGLFFLIWLVAAYFEFTTPTEWSMPLMWFTLLGQWSCILSPYYIPWIKSRVVNTKE